MATSFNLMMGAFVGQMLVLLTSPIISRIYSPKDIGLLSNYSAILSILALIACLKYDSALPLSINDCELKHLTRLCFEISVIFTGLVSYLVVLTSIFMTWDVLGGYLWLIPISVIISTSYQIATFVASRKKLFNALALTKIYQSSVMVILQIVIGVLHTSPLGLIVGLSTAQGVGSNVIFSRMKLSETNISFNFKRRLYLLKKYRRFALYSAPSALISGSTNMLPFIIVSWCYDLKIAGLFYMASQIITIPFSIIRRSLIQIYLGEASKLRNDFNYWYRWIWKFMIATIILSVIVTSILYLSSNWLFVTVLGEKWVMSSDFAKLLIPMFAVDIIAYTLAQTLVINENQKDMFYWDLFRCLTVLGGMMLIAISGSNITITLAYYTISNIIFYVLLIYWAHREVRSNMICNPNNI